MHKLSQRFTQSLQVMPQLAEAACSSPSEKAEAKYHDF